MNNSNERVEYADTVARGFFKMAENIGESVRYELRLQVEELVERGFSAYDAIDITLHAVKENFITQGHESWLVSSFEDDLSEEEFLWLEDTFC